VPSDDVKPDRGGGQSFLVVGGVFAFLLALGVSLGVHIHGRYVAAERVVARHVPSDATLVVRWDVEKVTTFEPTRRFLLPLVDSARAVQPAGSRMERLKNATGLSLGRDVRELALVFGPGSDDWAVLVGGSFPKTDLVAASERLLAEEGWRWTRAGRDRLTAPEGVSLGQAPDGAVAFASSTASLMRVLPASAEESQVPRTGAGALVARVDQPGFPAPARALLLPLGELVELRAQAEWGSPLPVTVTWRYARAVPPDVRERFRRVLTSIVGDRLDEIERAGGAIDVQSAGNLTVQARFRLDDPALETVAERARGLARERIRSAFGRN
jgi:hypothetical protein